MSLEAMGNQHGSNGEIGFMYELWSALFFTSVLARSVEIRGVERRSETAKNFLDIQ
jgi:hypothetical protein